jgi:hypothetical protein
MTSNATRHHDGPPVTGRVSQEKPHTEDPSKPSTSAAGDIAHKVWTVTGRLCVRETELPGDGANDRPLKGIEVKVSASNISSLGPWTSWGTVHTGSDGNFTLEETNDGDTRFFLVEARLVSHDLEVNESKLDDLASFDLLDENWRTVWKSDGQMHGPKVQMGTKVFGGTGDFDLGVETYRRQALVYYVIRSVIDRLEREDPWFAFDGKVAAIYPAHCIGGTSYTNGLTRMIYLHQANPDDHWHPATVIHELFHMWNYDHNHGTINWLGAVCSLRGPDPVDLDTHNPHGENPNVAFAEGCSEWASNAVLHRLWGARLEKPYHRRYVTESLGLSTLEMVEKSDFAVASALRLMSYDLNDGWWTHLLGTADTYPDNRVNADGDDTYDHPEETGVAKLGKRDIPAGDNFVDMWDMLRTFRASPADGWKTDLEVGNVDYGIVRFIDRAVDIHHLGEDVRTMLKRSIDPLATDEPRDMLALTTKA